MSATIGTVIIDIKADTAKLVSGMDRAESSVKKSVDGMKKAIIGMVAAYAGIQSIKAFKGMVTDSIDAADATGKLAQKLGLTAKSLSEFQYAAGFAAVSQVELSAGLSAMIRRLNNFQRDGGGPAAKAMETLGISAEFARKNMGSTDEAFKEILKRLEQMPDGYKKTAVAQDIFSKSASGILRLTATDLAKFIAEAERLGIAIPDSAAKMAAAYHDQMDSMKASVTGLEQQIAFGLLPAINAATETTLSMLSDIGAGTEDFSGLTEASASMIISMVTGIGYVRDSWTGVTLVMKTIEEAFYFIAWGINAVFDSMVTDNINKTINAYNAVADLLGQDKLDNIVNETTEKNKTRVNELSAEIAALTLTLTDGRTASDIWAIDFSANLKKIMREANAGSSNKPDTSGSGSGDAATPSSALSLDESTLNIIKQYETAINYITTPLDKINAQYGAQYEVIKDLFDPDQMQAFYAVWGQAIDDTNEKHSSMFTQINSDIEAYGLESQDWTAGLDGVSKSIANIGNSFADIGEDMRKYNALQKEINASTASEADKKKALANLDSKHNEAQLSYLATAAGAMANMYEEGSKGALALQGIQASLAVAAGITAILTQGEGEPYSAFERILAMAGIVSSYLSTIGESISGGGSTGPSYGSTQASRAQSFSELNYATGAYSDVDFENFKKGLDSATQALEDFGNVGSVVGESLTSLDAFIVSRESDLASMIAERDKRIADAMINPVVVDKINEAFDPLISSINDEILEAEQERLDILSSTLSEMLDFSRMSIAELQSIVPASFDLAAYNASLDEINRLALKKKTGSITDTDLARLEELTAVGGVWQIGQDYADAIDLISDAMETSTENIKTFNDSFKTQEQLLDDLAKSIGVSTAKTTDELHSLFDLLANDVEGLTDAELKLLTANKAYIESMAEAEEQRMADMAEAEKQRLADITEAAKATAAFEKESFDMIEAARAARMSIYEKEEADRLKLAEDYASKLDALYLGTYSPLSMLGQTAYANNIAAAPGNMNNYESSFLALQTAAKSVTRDEDLIISFNHTAAILKEQQKDSTRADIIDAIQSMDEKQLKAFSELSFRLRKLEAAQIETNDTLQAG